MNRLLLTVRNIFAIAVIGVVANVLSMLIMQFFVITDFEIRFVVAYVIPMTLVLCGVAIYDSRVAGHKERCMLRASGFDPVALLWGIILIVALSVVLAPLMRLLPENNRNIPTGLFTMLCVVVVAPIFEEILFRDRVFSVLRSKRLGLKYNTASILEMESGSNDPCSYMLTVFFGKDSTEKERADLTSAIAEKYPSLEAYFIDGGQEIAPYIFVAE
jgi:hypothetical protein